MSLPKQVNQWIIISFSPISLLMNSDIFSCACHLTRIVWKFFFFAFRSISFALKKICCLSVGPCFGPLGILSDNVAIDRAEVVLWKCCRTSIIPQFSCAITVNNSNSRKELQSGHWSFLVFSQSSKTSVWFLSFNLCVASLNLLICCLAHVLQKKLFLKLMGLKLLD